ncbi:MAG: calcium-binding protein, partial [Pseudorhodoplanes sp.]
GDGYPMKANGSNFRYLLEDGTLSAPVDEALDFTAVQPGNALGEQDALAAYMQAFYGTAETAFDEAETPISEDTRIQNLTQRDEDVFASAPVVGTEGKEALVGGIGDDTLDGSLGKHKMAGGAGDDTYIVGSKSSKVIELDDQGTDTVETAISFRLPKFVENLILSGTADVRATGNSENNVITGNAADNRLSGGNGDDTLDGGEGDDILDGGRGNDILIGGAGDDVLRGRAGNDTFVFAPGFGNDEIKDFRGINMKGGGDVIQFDSAIFADFNAVLDAITDNGNTLTIDAGGGDTLTLKVKDVAFLNANDFLFV